MKITREELIKELGDLEFYLEAFRQCINVTREDVLTVNIDKLTEICNNLDSSVNNYLDVLNFYSYGINQQVISEDELEEFTTVTLPKRQTLIDIIDFDKELLIPVDKSFQLSHKTFFVFDLYLYG